MEGAGEWKSSLPCCQSISSSLLSPDQMPGAGLKQRATWGPLSGVGDRQTDRICPFRGVSGA